jgi:hypothetical protein
LSSRPIAGSEEPADQRQRRSALARKCADEYLRTGSRSAAIRAVAGYRLLVLSATNDEDRIEALNGLSASRQLLFESRGLRSDIDDAIERGTAVLAMLDPTRPRTRHHANLGNAYRLRFEEVSADRADLRAGLQHAWDALDDEAAPHVHAQRLSNFGLLLRLHFEALGRRDDIDESVDVIEEAVELADATQRPQILSNASTSRRLRGARYGIAEDLHESRRLSNRALRGRETPEHLRVGLLINAALPDLDLFHLTGIAAHLKRAELALQLALKFVDPDSPDRLIVLINLANLKRLLATADPAPGRSDEAIEVALAALAALPVRHPDRPRFLAAVGRALRTRLDLEGRAEDAQDSVRYRTLAADYDGGDPYERALSAYTAGLWASEDDEHGTALHYLLTALDLLPKVVWLGLDRTTVLAHTVEWQDLARDVAASAIQNDELSVAIAALERGRTVFWSQVTGYPDESRRLRSAHPGLGDHLDRLDRIGEQLAAARAAANEKISTSRANS